MLQANRDALALLGLGNETTTDLKGQVLRQMRLAQNLDPAVLATEACISLAQLYEIEKGIDSLFYSDTLRQQAARRVSQLLSIDWDQIDESDLGIQTATNVVSLQRGTVVRGLIPAVTAPTPTLTLAASPAASPIDIAVNSHNANEGAARMAPAHLPASAPTTFALGLSTPSADTAPTEPTENVPVSAQANVTASSHTIWWLLGLICVAAASFFVAEQEGYVRQYWPEYYQLISQLHLAF
ncbi:RodZ family helix-turn-helix domain-containing protein [Limnohabitans sp. T6-5]|uniref:helix-turn-helix domain-containing protein n=1 Tax=Limnohabitans sp. T6-5 TaxID=1100724 RepID=UPI0011B243D5|nr:helix-turn-helix transcriptional regulator [Limnohabitans sp. T6-5]